MAPRAPAVRDSAVSKTPFAFVKFISDFMCLPSPNCEKSAVSAVLNAEFSSFTTGGLLLMLSVMNFRVAKVNILWSFQHSSRRCTKTENVYSASDELLLNLQIITSSR
nr:PREDICTED: uncharacterized protein LOC109034494 isoform X2 [Bemisia tabaci]